MDSENQEEVVAKVMEKIDHWFMSNEEHSAEAIFNEFASAHADMFDGDGFENTEVLEGKLEWTSIHKEYVKVMEKYVEKLVAEAGVSNEDFAKAL